MPGTAVRLDEELTALIGAVYLSHEGLPERARALERAAVEAGDARHAALARLIVADVDNRNGRQTEGVRAAVAELNAGDDRLVVAHAHAVISGGLWRLGDNAEALKHAYEADRMLVEGDPICLRADHAAIFAAQVNDQRLGRVSHEEFRFAQDLAERLGDPDVLIANLNNWAWSSFLDGDQATALDLARRMTEVAGRSGHRLNASCADTVARVLLADGQTAEATAIIEEALAHAPATDVDAMPACFITYAEIRRAEGDVAGALAMLDRCRELTRRDGVAEMDAIALRLLAACHAELGDFATAYREMVEFHQAWTVRRSEQSEALASVTHARFAIDEANRDRERFRELAERDALTGLWNRRRSDDHLAGLIAPAGERGPVSVAILDLDHFKRINDTYSHEVGDSVLRRLGDVLRAIVEPGGYVARQGGEEFVLFLDGPAAEAAEICERVRLAVAGEDWSCVVPGLRVTTSIGLTDLRPGDDARTVLARADAHLYRAKSAGRDVVVAG